MSFTEPATDAAVPTGAWYALYTRHQHEKTVALNLEGKGFQVFLPLYNAVRRWKDRTKQLSVPLFPCYVFLRTAGREWLPVLTTPGVHMVVSCSGLPTAIPDVEIDAIRRVVESSGLVEPHPFLKTGDWVRVRSGPLADIEGILVRKKSQFRLVLSVEMLGKSASVEVDLASVERITRGTNSKSAAPTAPREASLRVPGATTL
jgi:transcription antitermination factor NusG